MKTLVVWLSVALAVPILPLQAGKILIDDFSDPLAPVTSAAFHDGTMLGSELDVIISPGLITAATFEISGGLGILSNVQTDDLGDDSVQLIWDGEDNATGHLYGLGGVDFTEGGTNDRFKVHVSSVTGTIRLHVRVWVSGFNFSTYEFSSISAPGVYEAPFSGFSHVGGTIEMESVNQIGIFVYPDDNEGISLDRFEASGPISEDVTPPTVRVDGKARRESKSAKIKLKGSATDNVALVRVEVKERNKRFRPAALSGFRWSYRSRRLKDGRTTFKVRSVDANGNLSVIDKVKVTRE